MLAVLALLLSAFACALAEDAQEYRDDAYAFRYPAGWSLDKADNGDIVLLSPDKQNAVLTFVLVSDLVQFTGDAETDDPNIKSFIAQYGGNNLALTGEYEPVQSGELRGFRAFGSWRATGHRAQMLLLTGRRHVVGFVMLGEEAIAQEKLFLDSTELLGSQPTESADGFLHWECAVFSLVYPANYRTLEQDTGIAFLHPDGGSIILARFYTLDFDYSDAVAPFIAAAALPQSTQMEPDAQMVQIGGRSASVIKGDLSGGPMEYYVIGSGRTALALMFTGTEAVQMAERVIQSVEIK